MKRFWTHVTVEEAADGVAVLLDGRPIMTPERRPLAVPRRALAEAIAEEWRAAGPLVHPEELRLTGLANAALDHAGPARESFAARLSDYAACDTLCYRAEAPEILVARQMTIWEPLMEAVEARLDTRFLRQTGVEFQPQPEPALERVRAAYAAQGPFRLAALSPVVSITASAILGLALAEGLASADEIWRAGLLEEMFQAERWGEDADAAASRALRRSAFDAGVRLLALA
ncbi:MAG: ATP12 family chaperone protein [Thermaurantiacus sp.]